MDNSQRATKASPRELIARVDVLDAAVALGRVTPDLVKQIQSPEGVEALIQLQARLGSVMKLVNSQVSSLQSPRIRRPKGTARLGASKNHR